MQRSTPRVSICLIIVQDAKKKKKRGAYDIRHPRHFLRSPLSALHSPHSTLPIPSHPLPRKEEQLSRKKERLQHNTYIYIYEKKEKKNPSHHPTRIHKSSPFLVGVNLGTQTGLINSPPSGPALADPAPAPTPAPTSEPVARLLAISSAS